MPIPDSLRGSFDLPALVTWHESLRADAIFGWRQLVKRKTTSVAAVLSLALGIGACTAAFRLIDALLLRPLPISDPGHLYVVSFAETDPDGKLAKYDSCSYPMFREWRKVVGHRAELIAVSYAERADLTFGPDAEVEKADRQYVSGWIFTSFGLQPALGRLLAESDDLSPGAQPYAVISYDYWTRRFGRDPKVVGRTFRMGQDIFEIVGVAERSFTGTEPGTVTDIFVPTMMNKTAIDSSNSFWVRTFVRPAQGVSTEILDHQMSTAYRAFEQERAKGFINFPKHLLEGYPRARLSLRRAATGVSGMQDDYRASLAMLAILGGLLLLIACANVANLMAGQAAARAREMALRVSIGAGRPRLIQLVLVESAWLATFAAGVGAGIAWWAAPVIVSMINPPDNPARLVFSEDWRILAFGLAITIGAMLSFGLAPALRASAVRPVEALKGGGHPHSRQRLMQALIAVQTAFCFLVVFVAGLFVVTFERLSNQRVGFPTDRLLTLETVAEPAQSPVYWSQVADYLRTVPGVDGVALAGWPLMSGTMSNHFVSINAAPPTDVLAYFLNVSPGWVSTMRIPFVAGRDFLPGEMRPDVAIVNQAFAQQYFDGQIPLGKSFEIVGAKGERTRFRIVGLVGNAVYRDIREPMLPQVYTPFPSVTPQGAVQPLRWATIIVRTTGPNPLALAPTLRREVTLARPEFRVSNLRTQLEIVQSQTVRERLLAKLALFFGLVSLLLAGVGLYGVLDYSVLQKRKEISIRMALGAMPQEVARRVTSEVSTMLVLGGATGVTLGLAAARYIRALLYQVKPTDPRMLGLPVIVILATALLAALPPIIRAVRLDPATTLRDQ